MDLWDSYCPITLQKMGVESPSSEDFPLMEVLNNWEFLTSIELVDLCNLKIYWIPVLIGETVVPIITGDFIRGDLTEMLQWHGVLPSLPILLTRPGVQRARTLLHAVSVMTSVVRGITRFIIYAL